MTAGEVEAASSALARFVGVEAYEAAGGVVRRDLFDSEHSRFLADPALLQRLATDQLEAVAGRVREEGWAWVEVRLDVDSHALRQFTPAEYAVRQPSTDEREALEELDQRSRELDQLSDALPMDGEGGEVEAEAIDLEEQDIAARRRAIQHGLRTWTPAIKAVAGAIVTVSREGDAEILRGLLRESDRKTLAAARHKAEKAARRVPAATAAEGRSTTQQRGDDGAVGDAGAESRSSTIAAPKRGEFSDALTRRLAAHRTLALQAMLSRNTPVALVALTHALAQRVLGDEYRRSGPALQVTAQASVHALTQAADDLQSGPAWGALASARESWVERLPQDRTAWFAWLLALPQAELLDLLALCAAATVNALPSAGTAFEANALAVAVGLDMADWWSPTAEGFLLQVSKVQIVQALKEAGPGLVADGVESVKKDMLIKTAAARLAGKRWLPAPLRPPPT